MKKKTGNTQNGQIAKNEQKSETKEITKVASLSMKNWSQVHVVDQFSKKSEKISAPNGAISLS